jgi:cob(I)alamin adenosyltransferase
MRPRIKPNLNRSSGKNCEAPRFLKGLVHVITGPGPGKTTSAIGLGVRAAGHGYNVCMIQFMKCGKVQNEMSVQDRGEITFLKDTSNFSIISFGRRGFVNKRYVNLVKQGYNELRNELIQQKLEEREIRKILEDTMQDVAFAENAMKHAQSVVQKGLNDLVILDEINIAMEYNLVAIRQVIQLIRNKPVHVELVLTGRDAPTEVINLADYVVAISEVKHPFKSGKLRGRRGIEF